MNYSFEYIDIILLAMIAGFIFLRLRGILGKKLATKKIWLLVLLMILNLKNPYKKEVYEFDDSAKKNFLMVQKLHMKQ